jgi:GNAT superfamily N-acetyltransferase
MKRAFNPDVPGAPAIPGLIFRRFRGEADYPVIVAILDACNDADQLEYINTTEDIASTFANLTNCDPYRDMLFAEVNGETIAFSRVWWVEESAARGIGRRLYISLGFVRPDWRRRGLGAAMLRHNEGLLRQIARTHPGGNKHFRTWATDEEYGALALFASADYTSRYVIILRWSGPLARRCLTPLCRKAWRYAPSSPATSVPSGRPKKRLAAITGVTPRRLNGTMNSGPRAASSRPIFGR